ncbi:MAG: hypothetical protein UV79_C0008G0004 [candidate division TM6 bacterium GW2011_GWF2_43_17]|nr:MAG: hypothetical protein UV79_C0008G0004 [candidate division TM6 bacterium GW2011_GWF2_43_17]HAU30108.1 hypothetical protein [Candidatus Dependentiae bacterium]
MHIKRIVWVMVLAFALCGSAESTSGSAGGEALKTGGFFVVGGLAVWAGFKYIGGALTRWIDRRLVGDSQTAFSQAQARYKSIISIYQSNGLDNKLREHIIAMYPRTDSRYTFSRFVADMRRAVLELDSYLTKLAYLEKKDFIFESVVVVRAQIAQGKKIVAQLKDVLAAIEKQRVYFEVDIALRGGLPSKNLQDPFQTIGYVKELEERASFLKRRSRAIKSQSGDNEKERDLLGQIRTFVKRLEAEISRATRTDEYRQELRLKRDTDLAKERLRLERERFSLEKHKVAIKEEETRELRLKNRLKKAKIQQSTQETIILQQENVQTHQQCSVMQKAINERDAYTMRLQSKISALEEQKEQLKAELVQKDDARYRHEIARLEQRLNVLEEKIKRLKALVDLPPMNPNHPDYARFLEQQIRGL